MITAWYDKTSAPCNELMKKVYTLPLRFVLLLISIELSLRICGWVYMGIQDASNLRSFKKNHQITIVAIGESTTAFGGENSWPRLLEQILHKDNPTIRFAVINKGVPGTTTNDVLLNLNSILDTYKPQIVITMLGFNDLHTTWSNIMSIKHVNNAPYKKILLHVQSYKLLHYLWTLMVHHLHDRLPYPTIHTSRQIPDTPPAMRNPNQDYRVNWNELSLFQNAYDAISAQNFPDAETYLKRIIEEDPKSFWGMVELANLYRIRSQYNDAKIYYDKSLTISTEYPDPYIELADVYRSMGAEYQAEMLLQQAASKMHQTTGTLAHSTLFLSGLENDTKNLPQKGTLGLAYRHIGMFKEIEMKLDYELLKYPDDISIYKDLGNVYIFKGDIPAGVAEFQKAIDKHPASEEPYMNLITLLWNLGKTDKAKEVLDTFISQVTKTKQGPHVGRLSYKQKEQLITDIISKRAITDPQLDKNYQKIRDIVINRGMTFMAMQYPMRSILDLKNILLQNMNKNLWKHMYFVDNEQLFKQALQQTAYDDLFTDRFGYNFGHATKKGNELIANNVAEIIKKEIVHE